MNKDFYSDSQEQLSRLKEAGESDQLSDKKEGEWVDALNMTGEVIGCTQRGKAHKLGIRHRTSNAILLFFQDNKAMVLSQLRAKDKALFPNRYTVSGGGHIGKKCEKDIMPTSLENIIEEISQELGLSASSRDVYMPLSGEKGLPTFVKVWHYNKADKITIVQFDEKGQDIDIDDRNSTLDIQQKQKLIEAIQNGKIEGTGLVLDTYNVEISDYYTRIISQDELSVVSTYIETQLKKKNIHLDATADEIAKMEVGGFKLVPLDEFIKQGSHLNTTTDSLYALFHKRTDMAKKLTDYASSQLSAHVKANPAVYLNPNAVNPYELLGDSASKAILEHYICNIMFKGFSNIGDQCFGEAFWEKFLTKIEQYQNLKSTEDVLKIYDILRNEVEELASKNNIPLDQEINSGKLIRASKIGEDIAALFAALLANGKFPKEANYLDIGCGDGYVTLDIIRKLGILADHTFGVEIGVRTEPIQGIHRFGFDGRNLPKDIPKVDLVTILQVLHHTENEDQARSLLSNIYDRMNPGAFLLIKDHNAETDFDKKWWNVRHLLPIRVSKLDPPSLVFDGTYKSLSSWKSLLEEMGLVFVRSEVESKYADIVKEENTKYSFYLLMQKK